jgi:hypothetical protein
VTGTLADAIVTGSSWGPRQGKLAFNSVDYRRKPSSAARSGSACRRRFHDEVPVMISWKVDFNTLTSDSHFSFEQLRSRGPGRHGGHMTAAHDYQADGEDAPADPSVCTGTAVPLWDAVLPAGY